MLTKLRRCFGLLFLAFPMGFLPVAQGYELVPNTGHSGFVQDVALSPDGRILATASYDRTVRLWTLDGRLLRVLRGHGGPVLDVEFHHSGALLASIADDGRVRLWDVDGTELWSVTSEFLGMENSADAIAFSGDTLWYLNVGSARALDLDGSAGEALQVPNAKQVLATAVTDQKGRVWYSQTRGVHSPQAGFELPSVPKSFLGDVVAVALRGDDGEFLVGSDYGCVARVPLGPTMQASSKWELIEACDAPDNWPMHTTRIVEVFYGAADGHAIALRADGHMMEWGGAAASARITNAGLPLGLSAGLAAPEAGVTVVASGADVIAIDGGRGPQVFGSARAHYTGASFAPEGGAFVLATQEGRLEVWRGDGSLAFAFEAHPEGVRNVLWHPGGLIASVGGDSIAVWRPDGQLVFRRPFRSGALAGALRWEAGERATLAISGGNASRIDLAGYGYEALPLAHELGAEWGAQLEALMLPGDGRYLALGEEGGLWLEGESSPTHLEVPESERFGGPAKRLVGAQPYGDGGFVTLDGAGRLTRYGSSGERAWTHAVYAAGSFTSGRFTEVELQRTCQAQAKASARGLLGALDMNNRCVAALTSGEIEVDELEACSLDPVRIERMEAERFEACLSEPDRRAALRPAAEEGEFSVSDWRAATLSATPWLFWSPSDPLIVAPDDGVVAAASWDGRVTLVDADGGRVGGHGLHDGHVHALAFSPDGRYLLSVAQDARAVLYDRATESALSVTSDGTDWIGWGNGGRFTASRGGADLLSVSSARRAYPVDQFAPALNDPADLLEPLGLIGPERAAHYRAARTRRYERLGNLADVDPEALPTAEVIDVARDGGRARLSVRLAAADAPLSAWQVWMDDVPLHPRAGLPIEGARQVFEGRAEVELIDGINRIEVAAIDARGQSSLRAEVRLQHEGSSGRALWFAGFGISDYRLAWLPRLFYAAKDARDIGAALAALDDSFDAVNVRTWTDDEVSETALDEAHAFLAQAAPGDQVVFFIAGHGTYGFDDDSRFYYLLPESDEDDLAGTALDFEQVEAVLFGLEARDKLFLMDTCQSGEPVGSMELARYDAAVEAGVLPRVPRPERTSDAGEGSASKRPPRVWLRQRDRFVYADLARRSGAVVFSSAMGNELSNEASFLRNGYFTQGLLNALSSEDADLDGDGALAISELYDKVRGQVQDWSDLGEGPTQNPVIDRDNLRARFALPLLPEDVRARFIEAR